MKRSMIVMCVVVVACLCFQGISLGSVAVTWNTAGAYMENLGNTTSDGSNIYGQTDTHCDKVTLGAFSGSLNLDLGVPQIVVVNPLTFEIGWTGDMSENDSKMNVYTLTRDITVNGITKHLVQTMTHVVTYFYDSLIINAGSPVAFGDITVTPLGWTTGFFSDSGGVFTQIDPTWHTISPVSAEFSLAPVPEPATIIIWSLLGGLGMVFAWRKRKSA
jgi:hypothetical protein